MFRLASRLTRSVKTASYFQSCRPRFFSTAELEPREAMEYDVVIVGAGPAGLATAIRLKQQREELSICLVEKGSQVGAHVLSGNVFDPKALDELIPEWRDMDCPVLQSPVKHDQFKYLTETGSIPLPVPPSLHNDGNYIISLGQLCAWLGDHAETLGVDVFPGFAASEVLYDESSKAVRGVATGDMGIGKDGSHKGTYARGMELLGKQTVFAEGAMGSCSEDVIAQYNLRQDCDPQIYGIGLKEIWQVPDGHAHFQEGLVEHTLGWPNKHDTYAGTFLYHMAPNLIHVGMVVGLDYKNPYLNPYRTFQQWKHHPHVAKYFEGAECINYGARVINEGGFQAIPKLTFPGGVLVGCSAGFVNVPRIKGSHYAMKSGILAADAIAAKETLEDGVEVKEYENTLKDSWVYSELKEVRNIHPSFSKGLVGGVIYSGLSSFVTKGKEPWTFHTTTADRDMTGLAKDYSPIEYPKPDGKLSFDLLTNLARSGTYHDDDQPAHLKVRPSMENIPVEVSLKDYAAPESRFCPAGVYEFVQKDGKDMLQINAQNCVHCKTCAIKTPKEYIKWTVPEGGGGPNYGAM